MKTLFTLITAVFVLAGRNTFEGLGKDISKTGEMIENASKKK